MYRYLFLIKILIILIQYFYVFAAYSQPTFKYGNTNSNYPSLIKNDGNSVYILGQEDKNGTSYGTIIKLDANSGNIIWQKELDFPSQINDMEFIPPQGPLGKTSLYIIGHTLPFDINNASFLVQINGETNAIECSNIFNQTGRESFRKIIRHSNPSNPNFPYYILGSKGIQGGTVTQDKVVLVNLRSFCSGGTNVNFVREFSFFANPSDMEFSRGLSTLSDGSILLMGNETNNGFGMAVKLTGAGNFVNGVVYSTDMEVLDAAELPNTNIVFSGTRFNNGIQSAVLFVTDSKLSVLGRAFEDKNILSYNDIVSEAAGSYYLPSFYKPVQNSNSTTFPVVQKLMIGGTSTLPSLAFLWQKSLENGVANSIYKGLSLTANFSGDLFYTDGRGLNNTNSDFTYAKSNSSFQLPCTDTLTTSLISFELGYNNIEITSSMAALPAPTQGNYRNTDLNRTAFCAEPCQLDFTVSTTERECNNVICNINITNGSLPYTITWDFNCDGMPDGSGTQAQFTFSDNGNHQLCVKVIDGEECVIEKELTIVTNGDVLAPVLTCPADLTIQCNESTNPSNTGLPSVTDDFDSNPTLTGPSDILTVDTPCLKKIVRSWKAEDDCKNESTCTQIITIKDEIEPLITMCGRKIVVQGIKDVNGKCKEKVALLSPMVTDQCDSNPNMVNSYNNTNDATADYDEGATIITWTATDQCGNSAICRDTVIVNCEPCCINRQDFVDRVENAVIISINTQECEVSLNINGLLPCDELISINWGDGNTQNGPFIFPLLHSYAVNGNININFFFQENNINGSGCFEQNVVKAINLECLCEEFSEILVTNYQNCIDESPVMESPPSNVNAPSDRTYERVIWTGNEIIVWGGWEANGPPTNPWNPLNNGKKFNPNTNTWINISNSGPIIDYLETVVVVWTGLEMIVWDAYAKVGKQYNPTTNTWSTIPSPATLVPRDAFTYVWTGKELILWGGRNSGSINYNTGDKYNPITKTWSQTSIPSNFIGRSGHSACMVGGRMLVWGGKNSTILNDGIFYNPDNDTWNDKFLTPVGKINAHTFIHGNFLIIVGGHDLTFQPLGGISSYNLVDNSWNDINGDILFVGLPVREGGASVIYKCNKIYIQKNGKLMAYNLNSNQWETIINNLQTSGGRTQLVDYTNGLYIRVSGNGTPKFIYHTLLSGLGQEEKLITKCDSTIKIDCSFQHIDLQFSGLGLCLENDNSPITWTLINPNGDIVLTGTAFNNFNINIQNIELISGIYELKIINNCANNSCTCTVYLDIDNCIVGTDNLEIDDNITIYPNPSSGLFTLDFKNGNIAFDNALIYDLHGRWIKTIPLAKGINKQDIDLFHNENGIYLIRLVDKNGSSLIRKIVKVN